jgi:hypothetical protein
MVDHRAPLFKVQERLKIEGVQEPAGRDRSKRRAVELKALNASMRAWRGAS